MIPANPNPSLGWHCLPYNPKATPITMDTYMKSLPKGFPKRGLAEGSPDCCEQNANEDRKGSIPEGCPPM